MKIDPDFQFDAFRFLLSGVRNDALEEWMGTANGVGPERSIQGWFERIQAAILELPQLLDAAYENADPDELLAQVGWDGSPDVDFLDDIGDATRKRLISLSVQLWKQKGTDEGLVGALRIFTGKTVIIRNWFYHRWVLDEAGLWLEGRGDDPWLTGTRYTEGDDELMWLILNRGNLDDADRRVVYDMLSYLHPCGEHFGVIYAAFADDFSRGTAGEDLGGAEEVKASFAQWTNTGASTGADYDADEEKGILATGGVLTANGTDTAKATWGPFQRINTQVTFRANAAQIAAGNPNFQIWGMISEDGLNYYSAVLKQASSTLTIELRQEGSVIASDTQPAPADGTPMVFELVVEPQDAVTVRATVYLGGLEIVSNDFVGVDAYDDPAGGISLRGASGRFFVDDCIVLASPNRVQYIGQAPITPVAGFGGPEYIADPDPGPEPFIG